MKNRSVFLSSLLFAPVLAGLAAVPAARAQVSTNLDALPSAPPAQKTAHQTVQHGHAAAQLPRETAPQTPPTPPGYTRIPNIPAEAPKPVIITPPEFPVVLHPPVPAADVQPDKNSHARTEPLQAGGLRVLFDTNSTTLNVSSIEAIRHYAESMAPRTEVRFILHSYATLPGNDVSMPRRLALSRALAIRSLMVQGGIATTRIYPIAQGRPDSTDTAPADRLDILPETNPPSDGPEKGNTAP